MAIIPQDRDPSPPRTIIYHHRHAHAPQNAKDFRNYSDVDNPNKMSLFSVFFHSVLCCVGMLGHLLFKMMFSWAFCRQALALFDMPNLNRFDILSISIFCKIALSISISISIFSKITISISISISIFLELPYRYRYRYRYFQKWPYRYRYFSKVSIYRQSICHIDISNRARWVTNRSVWLLELLTELKKQRHLV